MEIPAELEAVAGEEENISITNRDYEDEQVIAVDFGPHEGTPSLDVIDGTAIVVVDGEQFEFDVPSNASDVTVNDGILTIKG